MKYKTSLVSNKQVYQRGAPSLRRECRTCLCSVFESLTAFDIENHSKRAGLSLEGGGSTALHHRSSLSEDEDEAFLCLGLMLFLLNSSLFKGNSGAHQFPFILLQMAPCLDLLFPFFGFPIHGFFFVNLPLIHLFVARSWSTDCCEPDAPAAEAPAGSARDYSHYSMRLHWALVLCATSPLVSWQSEL